MSTAYFDDSSNLVDIAAPTNGEQKESATALADNQPDLLSFDEPEDIKEDSKGHNSKSKSKKSKAKRLFKRAKSPISGAINKTTKEFKKLSNLPKHHHSSSPKSPQKSPSKEKLTEEYSHLDQKLNEKKSEEWIAFQEMQERAQQAVIKTQSKLHKYASQSEDDEANHNASTRWTGFADDSGLEPEVIDTSLNPAISITCAVNDSDTIDLLDSGTDKPNIDIDRGPSPPITPGPPANSRITSMDNVSQETELAKHDEIDLLGLIDSTSSPQSTQQDKLVAGMLSHDFLGLQSVPSIPAADHLQNGQTLPTSDVLSGYAFTSSLSSDVASNVINSESKTTDSDILMFEQPIETFNKTVEQSKQKAIEESKPTDVDSQIKPDELFAIDGMNEPVSAKPIIDAVSKIADQLDPVLDIFGEPLKPSVVDSIKENIGEDILDGSSVSKPEISITATSVPDDFASFDPMKRDFSLAVNIQSAHSPINIDGQHQFGTPQQSMAYGSVPTSNIEVDIFSKIKQMSSGSVPVSPARRPVPKPKDHFGFVKQELKKPGEGDNEDDGDYKPLVTLSKEKPKQPCEEIQPEQLEGAPQEQTDATNNPFLTSSFTEEIHTSDVFNSSNAADIFGVEPETLQVESGFDDLSKQSIDKNHAESSKLAWMDPGGFDKTDFGVDFEADETWEDSVPAERKEVGDVWGGDQEAQTSEPVALFDDGSNPFQDDFSKLDDIPIQQQCQGAGAYVNPFMSGDLPDAPLVPASALINPFIGCATSSDLLDGTTSSDLLGGTTSSDLLGGTTSSDLLGGTTSSDLLGGTTSSDLIGGTIASSGLLGGTPVSSDLLGGTPVSSGLLEGSQTAMLSDSESFFFDSVVDNKEEIAVADDVFDPFQVTTIAKEEGLEPETGADALDAFSSVIASGDDQLAKPAADGAHGFKLDIKPVVDRPKTSALPVAPALAPPPKAPKSPQPPRENPFDRDSPPEENFAQFEVLDASNNEKPHEPPTKSFSTDSTTTEEEPEETFEPLEPYLPECEKDTFKLMLRYPTKKKIAGNRYWKNVIVKIEKQKEGLMIRVLNDARDQLPIQELPLQPCYSLSDLTLQQYDQYGKIHTVKLQYVFYKERVGIKTERITPSIVKFKKRAEKPKATMILDHSPQVSELLKFGSLDKAEITLFIQKMEDEFMNLEARREKTLTYTKDEVTAEVSDEYYAELDCNGRVISQKARCRVFALAFITGMPIVEMGLNDKRRKGKEVVGRCDIIPIKTEEWIKLENVEFHCSVNQEEFEKTNNIKFQPLDACQFELMRYRVRLRENKELPLQLTIQQILKQRKCEVRCDLLVTGYHSYSKKHGQFPCEDIEVRFPIPEVWIYMFRYERRFGYGSVHSAARKPGKIKGLERLTLMAQGNPTQALMEADVGTAKYEHVYRSIVWRIPRLPIRSQGAYTSHLFRLKLELGPHDDIPESFESHTHVSFTMPCSTVSQSQIRSIAVTNPNPPEKWVRSSARYEYRLEIEHLDEYPELLAIGTVYKEAARPSIIDQTENGEEEEEKEERDPRLAQSDTDSSDSD